MSPTFSPRTDRRPIRSTVVVDLPGDPIGSSGGTEAAAETGESESDSPLQSFLAQSRDFFAFMSDAVPRLNEPAPGGVDTC